MAPLVSILIPTFERSFVIKKTIQSILLQSYDNIEIIITDNSADNKTRNLVESMNCKLIKYYKNEKNIGPILNWKKAVEYACGEYFVILPDDDFFINPFYLEDCINISKNKKYSIIITDCILGYDNIKKIGKSNYAGEIETKFVLKHFWAKLHIPSIANFVRKDALEGIEYFYSNEILYSDIELWLKIFRNTDTVYFYNTPSIYYTFHKSNIVKNMDVKSIINNSVFITKVFNDNESITKYLMKYSLFIFDIYKLNHFNYFHMLINRNKEIFGVFFFAHFYYLYFLKRAISLFRKLLIC